jgi:hypothetical protein
MAYNGFHSRACVCLWGALETNQHKLNLITQIYIQPHYYHNSRPLKNKTLFSK